MKKLFTILAVLAMASPAAAQLIITGAFDGPLTGGFPKGVELFACDDIPDISVYGIGSANNGGGTDGVEFIFPAVSVAAGTTLYAVAESASFVSFFGFAPDFVESYAMSINGDDAVELFYVGGAEPVVVDTFGDINMDGTGTAWDHLDGWAKRISGTGPDGATFVIENWTFSGINNLEGGLTNDTCLVPFPVGGFYCDPAVGTERMNFGGVKSLYR